MMADVKMKLVEYCDEEVFGLVSMIDKRLGTKEIGKDREVFTKKEYDQIEGILDDQEAKMKTTCGRIYNYANGYVQHDEEVHKSAVEEWKGQINQSLRFVSKASEGFGKLLEVKPNDKNLDALTNRLLFMTMFFNDVGEEAWSLLGVIEKWSVEPTFA
jgi:hypothetical protein